MTRFPVFEGKELIEILKGFGFFVDRQRDPDNTISTVENKTVLTLANKYEDAKWRYATFQNFIWDNVAETSLSFS